MPRSGLLNAGRLSIGVLAWLAERKQAKHQRLSVGVLVLFFFLGESKLSISVLAWLAG